MWTAFRSEITGSRTIESMCRADLGKMLRIAKDLGARVQGDEGEFYDDTGDLPE